MCLVTPVFLVVFGTSLNASQSVCKMAGIEFLVLNARILLLVQSVSNQGMGKVPLG
jgi:hypothetical protein